MQVCILLVAESSIVSLKRSTVIKAALLVAAGIAMAAAGIHIGEADDAPGAALVGILLLTAALGAGIRMLLRERSAEAQKKSSRPAGPG